MNFVMFTFYLILIIIELTTTQSLPTDFNDFNWTAYRLFIQGENATNVF